MSNDSTAIISDMDLDDWDDSEGAEDNVTPLHTLDSRRRVESKLEELRLRRETSEFEFDL